MPTLITKGAMSVQSFGAISSSGGGGGGGGGTGAFGPSNYWFAVATTSQRNFWTNSIFNGVNNFCFYGTRFSDLNIGSFDENFNITFCDTDTYTSLESNYLSLGLNFYANSASNLYFLGSKNDYGYDNSTHSNVTFGNSIPFVSQLDNLGNSVWEQRDTQINGLGQTTNYGAEFNAAVVDSSNNIFCIGNYFYQNPQDVYGIIFDKYDSSGNLIYSTSYESPSSSKPYISLNTSPANNLGDFYFSTTLRNNSTGLYEQAILSKLNTNGMFSWTKSFGAYLIQHITSDSLGNVYAVLVDDARSYFYIVAVNASGTILWQKKVAIIDVGYDSINGIFTDNNNDVYIIGYDGTASSTYACKFDTLGNVIWQKYIGGSFYGYNLLCDYYNNIYINGSGGNNLRRVCVIKIPDTAAVSGTYTTGGESITFSNANWSYSSSSLSLTTYTSFSTGSNPWPYDNTTSTADVAPFSSSISYVTI